MPRLRLLCVLSASTAVLVALFTISSHGQTGSTGGARTLVSTIETPAIEGGLNPDASHVPHQRGAARQTIRAASRTPDRISRSGPRYAAGRVIVKFKEGVATTTRISAVGAVSRSATMALRLPSQNFDVVSVSNSEDPELVARAFQSRPDVEYAQAAYRVHTQFVPNDRFYPAQWNLPMIDLERAWDIQPTAGSTITVAVIDTGVAFESATIQFTGGAFSKDFDGNIQPLGVGGTNYPALGPVNLSFVPATELQPVNRFVAPHDFIWDDDQPVDLDGHGTHVSGTLGQLTNNGQNGQGDTGNGGGTAGVAFNVKLMPVKVISGEWDDIFGSPHQGTDDIVALGVRYAADHGAKIINMSIGRSGPSGCGANRNLPGCAPVIEDAVRYAVCGGPKSATCSGAGAFIAIAGGNDFTEGNPTQVIADIASRVPGAVSVAAVTKTKTHASYSSTGGFIEVAAPGGDSGPCSLTNTTFVIQQTLDLPLVQTFNASPSQFSAPRFDSLAYFCFAGTSQATPHVSGLAAMLMQQGITSPAAIEAALEKFATPCEESPTGGLCDASKTPRRTNSFGFGLIEARNTLRGLGLAK